MFDILNPSILEMGKNLTYKDAGVDIDKGEKFVRLISPMARKTFSSQVLSEIGPFSALFKIDINKYKEPVLVSGTDGVGTKLKIAFLMDKHDTVGIDLVAMCVNDILTSGAEPLFFLDYLAMGKLELKTARDIVKGIVKGCKEASCSLIGGETAEMPGFYKEGEYDLSGFAVGIVEKKKIINGAEIKEGDVIIGIASNGLHSNGFSLVRKVFFDLKKIKIDKLIPDLNRTLGEELLRPTRIYVKAFNSLKNKVKVKGMAHITGGGIPGNLPRIFPKGIYGKIDTNSWDIPFIFNYIKKIGKISDEEMKRTFNLGIGFCIIVSPKSAEIAVETLKKSGYPAFIIGKTLEGGKGVEFI